METVNSIKKGEVEVETCDDCFICGSVMFVSTTCPQKCQCDDTESCERHEDFAYFAYDGDVASCKECGSVGWVSVDGDSAYVNYDEECNHNFACYNAYERRKDGK